LVIPAFAFYCIWSSVILFLAATLVQLYAPKAAGAGVSLVMAYLNGNHVPDLLLGRTLAVKVLGTVLSCSASLAVGPEGPLVHVGAAVASWVTHLSSRMCKLLCCGITVGAGAKRGGECGAGGHPPADDDEVVPAGCIAPGEVFDDADQREFISAGTAAGLAAAFGAPIGGVMFAMEEACSFWSRKVAWRCFLAAVFAVGTISQLNHRVNLGLLSFDGLEKLQNQEWTLQAPLLALTAVGASLLGFVFNRLRGALSRLRPRGDSDLARILEVLAVGLATCTAFFLVSLRYGNCVPVKESSIEGYGLQFGCAKGEVNDLATAVFSVPEETIRQLYSLGDTLPKKERCDAIHCLFTPTTLALVAALYLGGMSLACGVAVPAGLFMPSIMVGGSAGTATGLLLQGWLAGRVDIQPGLYGLVGSTAMLGGVFRSSISLVVIIVEGTRGIDFLFGIIMAVVISTFVGHLVNADGVYESEIERNRAVYFLRHEPPRALSSLTARDVMAGPVQGFLGVESLERVVRVLRSTPHNGFPVFEKDAGSSRLHLEGIVLRSQLLVLLERRAFCRADGTPLTQLDVGRLDQEMTYFYSRRGGFNHRRHLISGSPAVDAILADWVTGGGRGGAEAVDPLLSIFEQVGRDVERGGAAAAAGAGGQGGSPAPVSRVPAVGGEGVGAGDGGEGPSTPARPLEDVLSQLYVDVRPFMNKAPLTVRQETGAQRVHQAFVSMGLRHLCVVDAQMHVVGIVTRKDLDHAAGHGHWRRTPLIDANE